MNYGSIRFQIASAVMVTTTFALLISLAAMVAYNLKNYRKEAAAELNAQARVIGRAVTPALQFDDPDSAAQYLKLLDDQPNVLAAGIYTERGKLFVDYQSGGGGGEFSEVIRHEDGTFVEENSLVVQHRIHANDEIIGFVKVRIRYELIDKLLGNLAIVSTVMAITLAISLGLSLRLQRSISWPLRSITAFSKRLADTRDFSMRAPKTTGGEIGSLVDAYNEMLDEVNNTKEKLEVINQNLESEVMERRETERALKKSEDDFRQLNQNLEKRVEERTFQLEVANKELEAFSYSVSHDLRTPLRALDGFSQALVEDYHDILDEDGKDSLNRVRAAAQKMGLLIDDILKLSRVSRAEINIVEVNLSKVVQKIVEDLGNLDPQRPVDVRITSGLTAWCDPHLIKIALNNLVGNAWKYTSKTPEAIVEFGLRQQGGTPVFFVRDNGAGFDMEYVDKLFGAFQRLHTEEEFSGSGIGLATVKRVISRHGGEVWAQAKPGEGAEFFFTLPTPDFSTQITNCEGEEGEFEADSDSRR